MSPQTLAADIDPPAGGCEALDRAVAALARRVLPREDPVARGGPTAARFSQLIGAGVWTPLGPDRPSAILSVDQIDTIVTFIFEIFRPANLSVPGSAFSPRQGQDTEWVRMLPEGERRERHRCERTGSGE